ncbi:MAG: plasmid pRiA4b ORF-3 family protein [Treponema sp.]|nr:plasmid pRiA4b ORF-3 family protein [Treponema sp.]
MTANQEEAIYEFLDNAVEPFELDDIVNYVRKNEPSRVSHLAMEIAASINSRNLAFPVGENRWVSRRGFFQPLSFVISPTRLELLNGILIPGHRCVPFANAALLPQEYSFYWQGAIVPCTTSEGAPEEFYPFYAVFGEEYAPQYVARDNEVNEAAFNSDPYDDPAEVSVKTLDMRSMYREMAFVPGDRLAVRTLDWKTGAFSLAKIGKDQWSEAELQQWLDAAEEGFSRAFSNVGTASCTEEQLAYAYWYAPPRMRELPAYSLEEFLYQKTEKVETAAYGIESRFWYAGREIPDRKGLEGGSSNPDQTQVEQILRNCKIPVSEYVVQSYVRDALFRGETDASAVIERLAPPGIEINGRDWNTISFYIEDIFDEFRAYYSSFADTTMGPIRSRIAELHTAVISLAARLGKGDIDVSWLPRHTFIILSQIQSHTAYVLEDLNVDQSPPETELEVMDSSLDSMLETYEDIKELIDDALDSWRRNKLTVIRPGVNLAEVCEHLIQVSIGGVDVWRRIVVDENYTLNDLHRIIQAVFLWREMQDFTFVFDSGEKADGAMTIKNIQERNVSELRYEYGETWNVRIMLLSRHESPASKPVRCVAGAGAAPPESINGPLKFKRIVFALEGGNDVERLNARQELGAEFYPG